MALIEYAAPWDSQPQEAVGIDWGNPLARGLVSAVCGSNTDVVTGVALAGGQPGAPYIVAINPASRQGEYNVPGGNAISYSPNNGRPDPDLSSGFTFLNFHTLSSGGTYATSGISAWRYTGLSGFSLGIRYSSANFYPRVGSLSIEHAVSLKDNILHLLGVSHDGTTARAWKDGINVASGATATPSYVFSSNYDHFHVGDTPLSLLYSRALSTAEHRALAANPWQLFAPQSIYVPVSAGGVVIPTLSLATLTSITATTARPRVSVSFP